jgi:methionyl-tRNA synthetase
MLHAAGIPLYRRLNVHGYWTIGGGKMSKSIGNVVEAFQLTDKYGHDAFRYFLLREMTFGLDANFSEEAFVGRLNADLANDLGNLVSRATTMIVNFGGGRTPQPGPATEEDAAVRAALEQAARTVDEAMEDFAFQRALAAIWEFLGVVNRYVDASAPWTLAKDPTKRTRLDTVLYTLAESLRVIAILIDAFLPDAAGKIQAAVGGAPARLGDLTWGGLASGTPVQKVSALFPRVEADKATLSSQGRGQGEGSSPASARIPIDDFRKVELRVAEVLAGERVPKSKKLLKLTVKVGEEVRTIVAGIAEHYEPESLVGRKIVVVANLEPATLMGIESNGMVLAASNGGALALLSLDKDLPPGAKVT